MEGSPSLANLELVRLALFRCSSESIGHFYGERKRNFGKN